jgi:hypothetical protein
MLCRVVTEDIFFLLEEWIRGKKGNTILVVRLQVFGDGSVSVGSEGGGKLEPGVEQYEEVSVLKWEK